MKIFTTFLFLFLCPIFSNAQDASDSFLAVMLDNSLSNNWDKRNFLRHYTGLDTLYCFANTDGERTPVGRTIYSYNSNRQIDTLRVELFKTNIQRYLEEKTYVYLYDEHQRIVEEQEICFQCFNNLQPINRRTFIYSNRGTLDTINIEYFEPSGIYGEWKIYEQDIYLNDLDGKVISITTQSETGLIDRRRLFFYNTIRQVIEIHYQDFSFGEWYTEKKEKFSDYNGEIAECITTTRNGAPEFYLSEQWLLETENGQVFSIAYSDRYNDKIDAWQCDERIDFFYNSSGKMTHTESNYYTYVDLEIQLMERTQIVHIPDEQFIIDTIITEKYYLKEKGWFNDHKTYRKQTINKQPFVKLDYQWNVENGGWVKVGYDSIHYSPIGQISERYCDQFGHRTNRLLSSERTTYQYDENRNRVYIAYAERIDLETDFILVKSDSSFFDENDLIQTTKTYDYSNQNGAKLTQQIDYEYNDEKQLTSEILRVVRECDTLVNLVRYFYEYNTNKHLEQETYQVFTDNVWTNRQRISYEYDPQGNIIVEQVESSPFGEWTVVKVTHFTFLNKMLEQSEAIFLTRFADTVGQVNHQYIYNASNQLIQVNQEELRDRYDWKPFANCIGYTKPEIVAQSEVYSITDFCTFSNPYQRDNFMICNQLSENEIYRLRIFDLNGRLLHQQKMMNNTALHFSFPTETGIYIFQLLDKKGDSYSQQVVIY